MITIISGTNRKNAVSAIIAKHYDDILNEKGIETSLINLTSLPHDFLYSALYENSGTNEDFNPYQQIVSKSNKYLFIVPEYNGSFPGALKAFIDGMSYPDSFSGKKCAMVGISSGVQGGVLAMSHLTDIFNYLHMQVLPNKPKLSSINERVKDDILIDKQYLMLLENQAEELINF